MIRSVVTALAGGKGLLLAGSLLLAGIAAREVWHVGDKERAVAAAEQRIYQSARFDSVLIAGVAAQRAAAMVRTDTVIRTVERLVRDTRTVVQRVDADVPDSVLRAFPAIAQLQTTATQLADSVTVLVTRIDTERAAAAMQIAVLESQLTASRIETQAVAAVLAQRTKELAQRTKERDARVSKWRAAGGVVGGLLIGYAAASLGVGR